MKVKSENGLLYRLDKKNRWVELDVGEADALAQKNNFMFAERMVDAFDGKTIDIDDKTKKIKTIEEDFV